MSSKSTLLVATIIILSSCYLTMVIGLSMEDNRIYFMPFIPLLYLATAIILLYFHKGWSPGFLLFLLIFLIAAFFIQLTAVRTGLIYGPYKYGNTLGPKLLDVPVIAIINKFVILYCVGLLVKSFKMKSVLGRSLLGAGIILSINIIAEPIATFLKFHAWSEHMFVFHNYGVRFLIAFAFLYLFNSMKFSKKNDIYLSVLLMEILFLIALNFTVI